MILNLKALMAKKERVAELSLTYVWFDRPSDQWYGLSSYEIFRDDHFKETKLRAKDGLFVTWDRRVGIFAIPPKLEPTLFAPISGVFNEFRLIEL